MDYVHTVQQLMGKKTNEYRNSLILAFADYEKGFYSVEHQISVAPLNTNVL